MTTRILKDLTLSFLLRFCGCGFCVFFLSHDAIWPALFAIMFFVDIYHFIRFKTAKKPVEITLVLPDDLTPDKLNEIMDEAMHDIKKKLTPQKAKNK